ncbi:hypothetical protein PPERSA_07254 [Pseudocohnilembus persalinus]|uniref:Uncharacterized protein n=1 Tax=Pseudocohnilembus persalinus TaxID=266149 RepID=A0A0V0QCW1_PSEPJ|nr:hypothetical protein PPERSA_07254 [Pseudocohnilembus persalinus]|eukprot:KRX00057.1 hypothetical protein PPERSA_07254 [Pseudocohnilembus persalinus]
MKTIWSFLFVLTLLGLIFTEVQGKKQQYTKKTESDNLEKQQNEDENLSEQQIQNQSELACPNSLYISCGQKIKNVILECSSEQQAEECTNNRLKDSPCYPCIEKIFPHFGEIQKNKKNMNEETLREKQEIDSIIHHFATCGNKEQFQCRRKLRNFYQSECQHIEENKHSCMVNKLSQNQCKVCLCSIVPEVCSKKQQDIEKKKFKDLQEGDAFEFLEDLDVEVNRVEQAHGDEKIKKDSLLRFGFLGKVGNEKILNSIKQIAGGFGSGGKKGNKGENKKENENEKEGENEDMGMLGLIMSSFLKNPAKTQNLLDKLDLDEEDFEDENMGFDDIQQVIAQKMLENPEVLAQFLEDQLSPEQLTELMNQPEYAENQKKKEESENQEEGDKFEFSDDEEFDNCDDDEKFSECQSKIMTFLPSCIGQEPLECIQKFIYKDKCQGCICRVLPGICENDDE